jgi:hypothetical protein
MNSHGSNFSHGAEVSGVAYSIWDGYTMELRGFPNADNGATEHDATALMVAGEPCVALTLRGPRGASSGVRYLNPGHVEQLERALAAAKRDAGLK